MRGRSEHRSSNDNNDRNKSHDGRGRSKSKSPKKFCMYCKKTNHFIADCLKLKKKEKKKNNSDGKASVVSAADSDSGDCLVVLAGCVFWS